MELDVIKRLLVQLVDVLARIIISTDTTLLWFPNEPGNGEPATAQPFVPTRYLVIAARSSGTFEEGVNGRRKRRFPLYSS